MNKCVHEDFGVKLKRYVFLTYDRLAEEVYDWFLNRVTPVSRFDMVNTSGRDLFQHSKIDDLIKQCVKSLMYGSEWPKLEGRWHVVLKVRLLFARDYFWSKHHHSPICEQWEDRRAEQLITEALTNSWLLDGLSWLILHRASLPIARACQHWELCESARWAASRYKETESWGYIPGQLSQDSAIWTLNDLKKLAENLRRRVEGEENHPFPVEKLHYLDAEEAGFIESTEWLVEDLHQLMKNDDFKPRSIYRCRRLSKRFEFALVYMSIVNERRPITRREAFATIGILCSVVWAKYGKVWLDAGTKPGNAGEVIEWGSPYHLTFEDLPHVNLITDILECPDSLSYFNTAEPYASLIG